MNEHIDNSIRSFEAFSKSPSHKNLAAGLRSCADGIEQYALEARSAVDILSNNELAQTIADLKAALQAFSN